MCVLQHKDFTNAFAPKRQEREQLYMFWVPERKPATTACCPGEKKRSIIRSEQFQCSIYN